MNRTSLFCMAAFAGLMTSQSALASADLAGDPVLFWNEQLLSVQSGSPVIGGRSIAIVNVAIHDAVNASLGHPNVSWLPETVGTTGDVRAAASVAAHHTMVALYPANKPALDAALAASLALVPDSAAKTDGMTTGALIADAVLAARATDGSSLASTYVPVGGAGHWVPTPPGLVPASLPQFANVTPFLMGAPDQFRPGAPPALDTPEYAAALAEVREIGAIGSLVRTADQTAAANFWAPLPANGTGPWIRAAIDIAQPMALGSLANASMLAQLSVASADATIALWDAKYHYDFWRPITAIRNADIDGNPLTEADPGWTSLIAAPPHPSYVSAHSAVAALAATILDAHLGSDIGFCLTLAGNNRCWDNFDAAAQDAADSRLWGGIHYRFDNEAGLALGAQVAAYTLSEGTFRAVPEPASWALMIAGFAVAGRALRARRRVTPVQFA